MYEDFHLRIPYDATSVSRNGTHNSAETTAFYCFSVNRLILSLDCLLLEGGTKMTGKLTWKDSELRFEFSPYDADTTNKCFDTPFIKHRSQGCQSPKQKMPYITPWDMIQEGELAKSIRLDEEKKKQEIFRFS
ncbi:hypothetical protein B0H19DRAFT_1271096 [Mycena capillaripes]|nr:hypothetical protein B0H19DRAFT_1271096 [Mycena capillaripes]